MRTLIVACLLLSACGIRQPDCVTYCGLRVFDAHDCANIQAAEDAAVADLAVVWPAGRCESLERVPMQIVHGPKDDGVWTTDGYGSSHVQVKGLTDVYYGQIYVGMPSVHELQDWRRSAFAHELAHWFDYAVNGRVEPDHDSWQERGIWSAVNNANSY